MLDNFREIAKNRCVGWRGTLVECNGEADHVHLLVSLPPTAEPAKFANNLKTTSSRLLRRDFSKELAKIYSQPVLWSASYFIVSCGGTPLDIIKQYVQDQETPE